MFDYNQIKEETKYMSKNVDSIGNNPINKAESYIDVLKEILEREGEWGYMPADLSAKVKQIIGNYQPKVPEIGGYSNEYVHKLQAEMQALLIKIGMIRLDTKKDDSDTIKNERDFSALRWCPLLYRCGRIERKRRREGAGGKAIFS